MNMSDFFTPLKVGILVLAGAAAGISMVVVLSGDFRTDGDRNTYSAYLNDVTGLAVQSRVHQAGVPVGRIESIELVGEQARVDISVRRDIELREGELEDGQYVNGATVSKRQASMIGDYFLKITPGQMGRVLQDGDTIPTVIEDAGLDQMFERLNDITADIQEVTRSLAAVFGGDEARDVIQQMVNDLRDMLQTLNRFVDTNSAQIDQLVADATNISRDVSQLTEQGSQSIDRILRDTEAIVEEVRFIIGQSTTDVQAGLGTLQGTLSRLQRTLDSFNYSMQNVQDITEKVNEGEGTVGQLINNPNIAQHSEQILEDGSGFLRRLTRLRTIVELRSEYHMANQQLKNVFGVRLQPDEHKYYLFEFVDDFRGTTTVETERVSTTDSGADDPLYQETRTRTTDEFKFSLIMGRSFQAADWLRVGGRFGIIESSGGIGAELGFLQNQQLEVNTDLFDFAAAENPRVRAWSTYRFLEFAYLSAGIDDAINPDRRDYFIGAGIRFDDEDLSTLLTTVGVPDL